MLLLAFLRLLGVHDCDLLVAFGLVVSSCNVSSCLLVSFDVSDG